MLSANTQRVAQGSGGGGDQQRSRLAKIDLKFRIADVGKWGWLGCEWREEEREQGEEGEGGEREGGRKKSGNFEKLQSNLEKFRREGQAKID